MQLLPIFPEVKQADLSSPYILFNVQSKRYAMFGKQNSTFWSAHIQQQIHKTSRLKAVKLKVMRVLQVVIKKKKKSG